MAAGPTPNAANDLPAGRDGWITLLVRWVIQQQPLTVMLFVQTCVIAYAVWWAMQTGVPQHLKSIKEGYAEMEDRHIKERAEDRQVRTETKKEFIEALGKQLEQLEKSDAKRDAASQKQWEIQRELVKTVENVEKAQVETNAILREIKKGQ